MRYGLFIIGEEKNNSRVGENDILVFLEDTSYGYRNNQSRTMSEWFPYGFLEYLTDEYPRTYIGPKEMVAW